jgi:hypothetical protein
VLTVDDIVPHLMGRGLLSAVDVVDRGIEATDLARRNLNLRVAFLDGSAGWIVKQPDPADAGTRATLHREASFYSSCATHPSIKAYVPASVAFEPASSTLFLDLVKDAEPLRLRYAQPHIELGAIGHAVGAALAAVHSSKVCSDRADWIMRLPSSFPWVLDLHRPTPAMLRLLSLPNMELIRILQRSPPICATLDSLRNEWSPTCLQHGDVKSENVLVSRTPPWRIALIDWELVQRGDPAWDVAGLLQDVLLAWLRSMPITSGAPDDYVARAALPLGVLRSFVAGFWDSYSGVARPEAGPFLRRAIAFVGARLLQSAYEANNRAARLENHAVATIQLALNILADPVDACLSLFGLTPIWTTRVPAPLQAAVTAS